MHHCPHRTLSVPTQHEAWTSSKTGGRRRKRLRVFFPSATLSCHVCFQIGNPESQSHFFVFGFGFVCSFSSLQRIREPFPQLHWSLQRERDRERKQKIWRRREKNQFKKRRNYLELTYSCKYVVLLNYAERELNYFLFFCWTSQSRMGGFSPFFPLSPALEDLSYLKQPFLGIF